MSDPTEPAVGRIGQRIHEARLLRGYSLRELGKRATVSAAQLSRVESGARYASPTVVAAVARALNVSVAVLYGQPYIKMLQADQLDQLLTPISAALDAWDIPPADDDPPPRSLTVLERELKTIADLSRSSDYLEVGNRLPGLIGEINHATLLHHRDGRSRERAHWLQADVGRWAYGVARRIGYPDIARHASARMAAAAPHSGDPVQGAIERWDRSQLMIDAGRHDLGLRLIHQALHDLDDDRSTGRQAMRGSLYLRAAILERRGGNAGAATDWLSEADQLAKRTGELSDHGLVFGPANVVIHKMSVETDRDQHAKALESAADLRLPSRYPAERAGAYWVSKARAEAWSAHTDEALVSLVTARKVAPQRTRYHPGVHETVGALLRARPRASNELRVFAQWCGV